VTETNGRKPKTGERLLRVKFRCGLVSRFTYAASALRWSHTGSPFDVVACERADKATAGATWNPVSGGY
jgi:hypothetical protein